MYFGFVWIYSIIGFGMHAVVRRILFLYQWTQFLELPYSRLRLFNCLCHQVIYVKSFFLQFTQVTRSVSVWYIPTLDFLWLICFVRCILPLCGSWRTPSKGRSPSCKLCVVCVGIFTVARLFAGPNNVSEYASSRLGLKN